MASTITTTARETFTAEESQQLAALIHKRWGWDDAAAAVAWRRLMQNDCSDHDFLSLALMAGAQVRRGLR